LSAITNKILKNTYYNSINRFVAFASSVILSIIVARFLGPSNFGTYSLVGFTVTAGELLANLGLGIVGTKYISEFYNSANKETVSSIVNYILKVKLIATTIVAVCFLVFSKFFANFYSDNRLFVYLIFSAACLFPSGLAVVFGSVIGGMQEYKYLAYRTMIISPLSVILSFVVLKNGYGIAYLILVNGLVSVVESLFYYCMIRRKIDIRFNIFGTISHEIKKRIFNYNWQVALLLLVDAIIWQRSEVFFLGKFRAPSEVGFYSLAFGIVEKVIIFLPAIFSGTLMPAMSELYGKKEEGALRNLYLSSVRYLLLISIPACMMMMFLAAPLINVVYGAKYLPVVPILRILLISGGAVVVGTAQACFFYGTENQRIMLKWNSLLAIFNLALDFVLIPRFGAIGAASANTITQTIGILIGIVITCHMLSVRFPIRDLLKVAVASAAMVPVIIVINRIVILPIGIIFSAITPIPIYFISLMLMRAYNATDMRLFRLIRDRLPQPLQQPCGRLINFMGGYIS